MPFVRCTWNIRRQRSTVSQNRKQIKNIRKIKKDRDVVNNTASLCIGARYEKEI